MEFINELEYFANVYKYEDRHGFKERWNEWIEENEDMIEEEKDRLIELGYEGDIDAKMFTSARYYFRKKQPKSEPKKRKIYTKLSKQILEIMDEHISNNYFKNDYTQKSGFEDFYEQNEDLLIYELDISKNEALKDKVKKTYKNRYYVMMKKIQEQEEQNNSDDEIIIIIKNKI